MLFCLLYMLFLANLGFYPCHALGFWNTTPHKKLVKRSDETKKNFDKIIRCDFKTDDSLLMCFNKNSTKESVQCSANLSNLSSLDRFNFDSFGIEQVFIANSPDFKFKYNLYPFKQNIRTKDRIFYNHQMTINYKNFALSLFSSDKQEYSGIKVNNVTCFKKLSDFISSQKNKVDLNITSVNSITKIVLIGDLYIINQPKLALKNGMIIDESNKT